MSWTSNRARGIVAVWLVALAVASAVAVCGFRIDNSVGVWFATDDPTLTEYRRVLRDFGGRDWLLMGLEQTGPSDARRADREALAAAARALPHVRGVLLADELPAGSALVTRLLRPRPEANLEAVWVQVDNDLDRVDGFRETLVNELRAAAARPTITAVRLAGTPVINGELNRAARHDMIRFFPAVVVLLTLLGLVVFRNVRDTAVLLAVALGTVTLTAGALIASGYALNMVTIMLPTVLIALSVADAVHLIHVFHGRRRAEPVHIAAGGAVRDVWRPCLGTSATTIAGFLAFAGSSVVPIFQLAVFASLGIALAFVLTLTIAPALLILLWDRRPVTARADRPGVAPMAGWIRVLERRPRTIWALFLLAGATLAGLAALRADTDYVTFFRHNTRVPSDYRALEAAGFPQNPLSLVLRTSDAAPIFGHQAALQALDTALSGIPGVRAVLSPLAVEALGGGPAALVEAGLLTPDGDQVQFVLMLDVTSSRALFRVVPAVRDVARRVMPARVEVVMTGTPLLWAHMDDGVIATQKESLLIVTIVCAAMLTWLFRSVPLALLGIMASLYPVAMVLGAMGLLGIPVNMATVLIAGVAVGLAVDDTIHFIHAWQAGRDAGHDPRAAMHEALRGVGTRMVATSVILVGAFASLGLSDFLPTAQFGLLSSLTILLALAADMAIVPLVLARRTA